MNDRYLFKAQHAHVLKSNSYLDGIWVKGYLADERYIISEKDGCEFLIDPKTICQCTGLKDKNGKLIWENDIVRGKVHCSYGYRMHVGIIEYYNNAFQVNIDRDSFGGDYKSIPSDCKVIGNIFDNPELLESVE